MSEHQSIGAWTEIYHPIEHAILSEYLGVTSLVSVDEINIRKSPKHFETYVCVEPDYECNFGDLSLANAVARICLEPVQRELPQWGQVQADGQVNLGRTYRPEANRPISQTPQHLFTINWADSGPGYSWPEAYHVTYLLGYHHYVVTAAQDSPDAFGYSEFAIGHFPALGKDVEEQCGQVIRQWWRSDYQSNAPWECFWSEGIIDEETAEDWALEAWEYQTGFDAGTPGWYEAKVPRGDKPMIRRFKKHLECGKSLSDLPDDLRAWWRDFA